MRILVNKYQESLTTLSEKDAVIIKELMDGIHGDREATHLLLQMKCDTWLRDLFLDFIDPTEWESMGYTSFNLEKVTLTFNKQYAIEN